MLNIALAKGRLADLTIKLLQDAQIDCLPIDDASRKLIHHCNQDQINFFLVKPSDVPTYVEYGVADLGVAGKDTLLEMSHTLYEMLDLQFGYCRMVVAGFPEGTKQLQTQNHLRIATKYPNIAQQYFQQKGQKVEIIKLNGSVELGPLVGLSDAIVDIVESGRTLQDNGLVVLEEICPITARLVVNRTSLKTKNQPIQNIIGRLQEALIQSESR